MGIITWNSCWRHFLPSTAYVLLLYRYVRKYRKLVNFFRKHKMLIIFAERVVLSTIRTNERFLNSLIFRSQLSVFCPRVGSAVLKGLKHNNALICMFAVVPRRPCCLRRQQNSHQPTRIGELTSAAATAASPRGPSRWGGPSAGTRLHRTEPSQHTRCSWAY